MAKQPRVKPATSDETKGAVVAKSEADAKEEVKTVVAAKTAISQLAKLRLVKKMRREMDEKVAAAEIKLEIAKLNEAQKHLDHLESQIKLTGSDADIKAELNIQ